MPDSHRQGANVILESRGGVILQFRDDLYLWGLFGGFIEDGEVPEHAVIREIGEELAIQLDPQRLSFLKTFDGPEQKSHLFRYPLRGEMKNAVLKEGLRYEARLLSDLRAEEVVPWHWHMLQWYLQAHQST